MADPAKRRPALDVVTASISTGPGPENERPGVAVVGAAPPHVGTVILTIGDRLTAFTPKATPIVVVEMSKDGAVALAAALLRQAGQGGDA